MVYDLYVCLMWYNKKGTMVVQWWYNKKGTMVVQWWYNGGTMVVHLWSICGTMGYVITILRYGKP